MVNSSRAWMLLRIKHGRSACSVEWHHSNVKAHCATFLGTLAGWFRLCVGALGCLLINLLHKEHVVLPCASLWVLRVVFACLSFLFCGLAEMFSAWRCRVLITHVCVPQGGGTQILGSDLCVWASGERQSSSVHTNCTSSLVNFICQELMGAVKDFTYWVLIFENRTSFPVVWCCLLEGANGVTFHFLHVKVATVGYKGVVVRQCCNNLTGGQLGLFSRELSVTWCLHCFSCRCISDETTALWKDTICIQLQFACWWSPLSCWCDGVCSPRGDLGCWWCDGWVNPANNRSAYF